MNDDICCWVWWHADSELGDYHRCLEADGHTGLHKCPCGAVTERADKPVAHPSRR